MHCCKRQLKEGLVFAASWQIQSIMVRKSWQQDLEAAGHIASSGGKQREVNPGTQLTFFSSETIAGDTVPSALDLPATINITQKNTSQKDMPEVCFYDGSKFHQDDNQEQPPHILKNFSST